MEKSIFEFPNVKDYLNALTETAGKRSGLKAELAQAARCHPAFISRVLSDQAQLNLEQGELIASFLKLTVEEHRYFLFLLEEERAGTPELRAFSRRERDEMLRKRREIKNRIPASEKVSLEHQAVYYSAWYYSAIHTLVSVPGLQNVESLAEVLNLPTSTVKDAVQFLEKVGILARKKGQIEVGQRHIHLDRSSPLLRQHHINWRFQCMQSLDQKNPEDLHYSAVFSLSRKDASELRERMLGHLNDYLKTIAQSPEETAYVYCFDFFGMQK